MPLWKIRIKELAEDFCISQVKINRMIKTVENTYSNSTIPLYYKGNKSKYLYDICHRKMLTFI